MSQCKKRLPDDEELTCNWLQQSGLLAISCGENQIWKGCAKTCSDSFTCEDFLDGRICADVQETKSMCVCKNGYVLLDGECVHADECTPNSGALSDWSDWSTCSVSCGLGVRSKTRICLGPGACKPTAVLYRTADCKAGGCGMNFEIEN
mgnify:CR=1 FL=1